jgi:Putative zinc-finger
MKAARRDRHARLLGTRYEGQPLPGGGAQGFLERYAGIESGRECERLAPALSAFVDGEGDAAQAVDLRIHLRQCLACRAAVRGLHDASRPLTVVFPAAGLAVASGGAEQANGLFVRVYEALSMQVHERTANSFLRAQAIVDTVTAGKMAAAAASAAALAGGGVAVEGVLSTSPVAPQAIVRRIDNGASAELVKQPAQREAKTRTHAKPRSHARSSAPRRRRAASRPAVSPASAPRASASPPAASTPRATVASQGSARAAGTSASGEFGFEGP